ncbi:hypothetical protein KP509_14G088800 [Ceratopteris richardii]|uniref:Uncharacterized protein n=1 Tax=Ceratopteris richardii TaxID=49495 RepID=A0A8T2TC23_CERRI|nr:hypothetical protein KP509_14G088800 [Ceratopteris richardii]
MLRQERLGFMKDYVNYIRRKKFNTSLCHVQLQRNSGIYFKSGLYISDLKVRDTRRSSWALASILMFLYGIYGKVKCIGPFGNPGIMLFSETIRQMCCTLVYTPLGKQRSTISRS